MLPAVSELKDALEQSLSGVTLAAEGDSIIVKPKDLAAVCRSLKETQRFELDYLANLTAVDYPGDRIEVVYQIYSMEQKHGPVTLRVRLNREQPSVESVIPIWRGAEYQEREVYDLFGVTFKNHPDLRRILLWEGFEGYPMRKDYVAEDQNVPEEGNS